MEKFKLGAKVRMYGCGDGSDTFWDGDKATVVGYSHGRTLICIPDDYRNEKHHMHPKQCRLVRKKGKGKKPLKRRKNPRTGSTFDSFMASFQ
jgi:hypothetical protein